MTGRAVRTARPVDGILHPIAVAALVVLIVNDQILKSGWPGPLTGILSDVAGLIVAPLAVVAAWEVGAWAAGRWQGPSRRVLGVAIVVVGVGFAATQVWDPAHEAYRVGLATLQWPFGAVGAVLAGAPPPPLRPVVAVADAGDLLALPALAITWWVGSRRTTATATATPAGPTVGSVAEAPASDRTPLRGRRSTR